MLPVFLLGFIAPFSHADIGRAQTKRERAARGPARVQTWAPEETAYQKIHRSFLKDEYSNADVLADQYLASNPTATDADEIRYLQALSLLKLDRPDEARQKLRQLEDSTANPELKANASASIADSYYYEGNHARAYESYKETMKKYSSSDQQDYLRERLLELSAEFGYTVPPPKPISPAQPPRPRQMSTEEARFYAVQVGSFSKPRNADQLAKKLTRQGYAAYVADDRSHGMNRVRVGRFSSKQEAAQWETKLRREGYPTKIIP